MAMSKEEVTIAVIGLFITLSGGTLFAATRDKKTPGAGPSPGPKKPPPTPKEDADALLKRANQKAALDWAGVFIDHPISPLAAAALARWAGIESSGRAILVSRLGERGLMQAGTHVVAEGQMSPADWEAINDPKTTKRRHADIAIAYVDQLAKRAIAHAAHKPVDPVDLIWYAKMYHQRPVDVRDGRMTGVALDDARRLAQEWANDSKAMHRLRAANVIAWGTATP